jgi:hypothetical protein
MAVKPHPTLPPPRANLIPPPPEEKIFASSMFQSAEELFAHARELLTAGNSECSIVYTEVNIAWSKIILDRLDQDDADIGRPR